MDQRTFEAILNRHIFREQRNAELIKAIVDNPDRYVGIFRSTTPKLKLSQSILQSREIRFGDAMEEVISVLLDELDFKPQPKRFTTAAGDEKSCDQYFVTPDKTRYYLVEQKVRDDHDSTKKVGQFSNFQDKLTHLKGVHGQNLVGAMYFIDPSLRKNRNYYLSNIEGLQTKLGIEVFLFYGELLFEHLGIAPTWEFITEGLKEWRRHIPESVELDFDATPIASWRVLRHIEVGTWFKLISKDEFWEEGLIKVLFPKGNILCLLHRHLTKHGTVRARAGRRTISYREVAFVLEGKLRAEYGLNPR